MITLGTLEEIKDLRTIWPHEAQDFTPWLSQDDNMGLLSNAIGIDIEVDETESPVGDFSVDVYASEVGTSRRVIIENQLEDTNHDHLGKLITYASGKDAEVVVWLVKHAREEHRSAIEWLNNHTDEKVGFFLCEIKLFKIGSSDPAVKFEVLERPNDWTKEQKKIDTVRPTQQARHEYWLAFQDHAFANTLFAKHFNRTKAGYDHWMNFAIGSSACHLVVDQLRKHGLLVAELYIEDDKGLFYTLLANKEAIEGSCGLSFDWRELPERKASRIVVQKSVDLDDRGTWAEQFDWIIDVLLKMRKAFCKYL